MRKIFDLKYLLCVALAFAGVTANAQKNVIDEVVWVVGDEAILKSDIEAERLRAQYEGQKWDGDPDCVIPEQMAIQKLYLHQAAIDSIEVTESEVQQRVEQQMNWYIQQIGSKEKMEEYFNKPSTQIREQLHDNIKDGLTVQKMQQQLVGDIKLTPAEVRRYFANIPQDSIPYVPTSVEVQIITLQPRIPQTEIDRIKDEMRSYTDRNSVSWDAASLFLNMPTWRSILPTQRRFRKLLSLNSDSTSYSLSRSEATKSIPVTFCVSRGWLLPTLRLASHASTALPMTSAAKSSHSRRLQRLFLLIRTHETTVV